MKSDRLLSRIVRLILAPAGLAMLLCRPGYPGDSVSLEITVSGVNPGEGKVVLSLFDSEQTFLQSPAIDLVQDVEDLTVVTFLVEDLAPGEYAVSTYYDKNGNNELDTGIFGKPAEPVGFSNNAKGFFGPPGFDKVSFVLKQNSSMEIQLIDLES